MGRLTLNILLSFAQFEREIISERTRDKIGAMRRKGKLWGGKPVLGYDVVKDAGGSRLVINEAEAQQVRYLFELYRQQQAMMPVVAEARRLGWRNKQSITSGGKTKGGKAIDKHSLWRILTNITYLGKVLYKDETFEGEHEAIVDTDLWQAVQVTLTANSRCGGHSAVRRDDALLRGLLVCASCGTTMMPTYTVKTTASGAKKRYRYYVCREARQHGHDRCPCPMLPAADIEQFVVDEIAAIGRDPEIRKRVLFEAQERLQGEQAGPRLDAVAATKAMEDFDPLWQSLAPAEQRELLRLIVERVAFDADRQSVAITFQPTGIASLGTQTSKQSEPIVKEAAA